MSSLRLKKPDQRGLDGVVSLEGILIDVCGSLLIGLLFPLSTNEPYIALAIAFAGVFGNIVDSILGATLPRRGYMTNDTVNFANTLFAAIALATLWTLVPLT